MENMDTVLALWQPGGVANPVISYRTVLPAGQQLLELVPGAERPDR
jgi:hypothetical protein